MEKQKTFLYAGIEFTPAYDLQTTKNRNELVRRAHDTDMVKNFNYSDFCDAAKDAKPADLYRCFYGLFLPRERHSKLISNYDELNDKVIRKVLSKSNSLQEIKDGNITLGDFHNELHHVAKKAKEFLAHFGDISYEEKIEKIKWLLKNNPFDVPCIYQINTMVKWQDVVKKLNIKK